MVHRVARMFNLYISRTLRMVGLNTILALIMIFYISVARGFSPSSIRMTTFRSRSLSMSAPLSEGKIIPEVTFKCRVRDPSIGGSNPFKWKNVNSDSLFAGKRVVLFALPGAFTPTCSSTHVPGYDKNYDEIKSLGIDEVYCLSVNDAFVMRQWGIHLGLQTEDTDDSNPLNPGNFKRVKFIPDGALHFTNAMGMKTLWDKNRGFGERSWRYSMVIDDNMIEKMFVEGGGIVQDSGPDPFDVSDAETMIKYLKSCKK